MLIKLLKYEFKSTGRTFLPIYGALLLTALLTRLTAFNQNFSGPFALQIFQVVVSSLFGVLLVSVFVLTLVVSLQRFYKSLLGEEGYLSMTLPVRPWQHICCKALSSLVWYIASGIAAVFSSTLLIYEKGMLGNFFDALGILIHRGDLNGQTILIGIEIILMCAASVLAFTLLLYASMALGQLSHNKRLLTSFGAFLALTFVSEIALGFISNPLSQLVTPSVSGSMAVLQQALLITTAVIVLFGAVYFFIANYLLSRKLNLE